MHDDYKLYHGDCLDVMHSIPDKSINLIACDLPYGTTQCAWDSIIPLDQLWTHYKRLIKPSGVIVLNSAMPFTATLYASNPQWFRYDLVWDKVGSTGHLDAKRKPLRRHESLLLFSPAKRTIYNPQMVKGPTHHRGGWHSPSDCYGKYGSMPRVMTDEYYPTSIVRFSNTHQRAKTHPTQKPLALMEWIVRTYSNEGDVVLDNACGSGTTLLACLNTGRKCIGIEQDEIYYKDATMRLHKMVV